MDRERGYAQRCTRCGQDLGRAFAPTCPSCGGFGDVVYDLEHVAFVDSENPYERFAGLLPVRDASRLPADARPSPLIHARRLGEHVGLPHLYLKDETVHPTGTTKDRMAAVALPYLSECGVRGFCTSSTGNSSSAYAHAIARFPELTMHLFTASDFAGRVAVPAAGRVVQYVLEGATFVEAFDFARVHAGRHGLVTERGFFNPGRREGLKLAWLEAAEQAPRPIDWYVQAVSSAMGVYGVDKGARELLALGRIERRPRLLCVQQQSCAPMVRAWEQGAEQIRPEHVVARPTGIATAILRGDPTRTYPIVRAIVAQSGGDFVAVDEGAIRRARALVEALEGLHPCFSAAAAVAGLIARVASGRVRADETVLVNLTGRERVERATATAPVRRLRRRGDDWVEAGSSRVAGASVADATGEATS